ncbi:MAG: anaerobic sulfatase maturase [Angelakisella sp.]
MPPGNLLIKPASGLCNMRCRYCFYADETQNRAVESFGIMTGDTLEKLVVAALTYFTGECTFAFQGGEPTLAGLPFFRTLIALVKEHNVRRLKVHYAIQTNGYVIDDEWAEFVGENNFLVGLSLDGTKELHDSLRPDAAGNGTYHRVLHAAQLLERHHVEYNLLTVVTAPLAKKIGSVYGFYKRSGFRYQQYIACLDPLGEQRGGHAYSLTPADYEYFLKTLFDRWYQDVRRGEFVYNRYFENLVGMLLGQPPESCGMAGFCSQQWVVEADGGVYPCDFYVLDEYKLGNLCTDSFPQLEQRRQELGFVEQSRVQAPECAQCRWYSLCRGGCRRDRDQMDGTLGLNYFCSAYRAFFQYAYPRLEEIARTVQQNGQR